MASPGQLYTDWYSAGTPPAHREITTTFQDTGHETESNAQWRERHVSAVAARMDQYPPI